MVLKGFMVAMAVPLFNLTNIVARVAFGLLLVFSFIWILIALFAKGLTGIFTVLSVTGPWLLVLFLIQVGCYFLSDKLQRVLL